MDDDRGDDEVPKELKLAPRGRMRGKRVMAGVRAMAFARAMLAWRINLFSLGCS